MIEITSITISEHSISGNANNFESGDIIILNLDHIHYAATLSAVGHFDFGIEEYSYPFLVEILDEYGNILYSETVEG